MMEKGEDQQDEFFDSSDQHPDLHDAQIDAGGHSVTHHGHPDGEQEEIIKAEGEGTEQSKIVG